MNGGLSIPSTTDVRFVPFVTFCTTSVKWPAPSLSYKIPAITTQQDIKICRTTVNRVNTQQNSLRHLWLKLIWVKFYVTSLLMSYVSSCDIQLMWHIALQALLPSWATRWNASWCCASYSWLLYVQRRAWTILTMLISCSGARCTLRRGATWQRSTPSGKRTRSSCERRTHWSCPTPLPWTSLDIW